MTHPLDKVIGTNLRQMRLDKALSQDFVGAMLNPPVSGQQVQKYEKGINRVSAAQLVDFAKGFNVKPEDFLNIEVVSIAGKPLGKLTERELIALYKSLAPDVKRCVEGIVTALASNLRMPV